MFSVSRNALLNENFRRGNVFAHLSIASSKIIPSEDRQGLEVRVWEEMMIDGGFENHWIREIVRQRVIWTIANQCPWSCDAQFIRLAVRQPLIQSKSRHFEGRYSQTVDRTQ